MKRSSPARLDFTQGPILRLVLLFALPICLGNVLQQLYSTVDTLVISNYCGTNSLAAIGTSSQPVEILLCIFMGIGSGVSILVSQYVGAGSTDRLQATIRSASTFLYLCALPVTALGILLGPAILRLMQAPEETIPYAVTYMDIVFAGTLASMGYNTNAGILRGLGDSRSTLYFLLVSCAVNIVLDLLFVAGFGWDVTGAALATVIAQYLSWLLSAVYLMRRYPEAGYTLRPTRVDTASLRSILRVGIPLGLNNSIYSIGHFVLQLLINTQGATFMAACSVASRVNSLANVAINSVSSAATTFSGQNLGAKKQARLRRGCWQLPLLSGVLSLAMGLCLAVFARPVLSVFGPEADVMTLAVRFLHIVSPSFWLYAVFATMISYANGMGIVRYPTLVNIMMLWVIRIPAALLIQRFIDGTYIMAAYPISFGFAAIMMLCYYLTPGWKRRLQSV